MLNFAATCSVAADQPTCAALSCGALCTTRCR